MRYTIILLLALATSFDFEIHSMSSSIKVHSPDVSIDSAVRAITADLIKHIKISSEKHTGKQIPLPLVNVRIDPFTFKVLKYQVTGNVIGFQKLQQTVPSSSSDGHLLSRVLNDPITYHLNAIKSGTFIEAAKALETLKSIDQKSMLYDVAAVAQELFNQRFTNNFKFQESIDLVSTPAHPVVNISPEIDARIENALKALEGKYSSDVTQELNLVGKIIQEAKAQHIFEKEAQEQFIAEIKQAIRHGIVHFIKEFDPNSALTHPREFMMNVARYTAVATFHIMTDGMFIGAEKAALITAQVHAFMSRDISHLTPNQRAEFIAEHVADIIKCVLADQIGRRVAPRLSRPRLPKSSTTTTTQEVAEVVTTDGTRVQVHAEDSTSALQNNSQKPLRGSSSVKPLQNKKTVEELINIAKPGRITKGSTKQYELSGGYNKALTDFEALQPKRIQDISDTFGSKKMGFLEDGTKILVRDYSKSGAPTLEIQYSRNKIIKFRY